MTITRNELIGKKVYNLEASAVGDVTDIGFSVGENQAALVVRAQDGGVFDIPWDAVSSAKDIVLIKSGIDLSKLKRAAQTAAPPQNQPQTSAPTAGGKRFCTSCGKPLTWIEEYKRWYCYNEKRYV